MANEGQGLSTFGPIKVIKSDGTTVTIADEDGNIDAPVTTTDLATSGTTTLGDAGGNDATVINAGTTPVQVVSADAGATGPKFVTYHNSASPANNDTLGSYVFRGKNDAAQDVDYVTLAASLDSVTDGAEEGAFALSLMQAGTSQLSMIVSPNAGSSRLEYVLGDILGNGYQDVVFGIGQSNGGDFTLSCAELTLNATSIGLFGATPVAQQATTGTTTGFTAGSGTAAKDDSTYTGDSGTAAYTVGDIVLALKNIGILAAD